MDQREFSKRFAGSSSRQEKVTLLDAYAEQLFENENYAQACAFVQSHAKNAEVRS